MLRLSISFLAIGISLVVAEGPYKLENTWPHDYPGKPSGGFSPEWQNYFEVTGALPNVTFPITRSFAGNIPIDRPGHPNDTLFFWAYEKKNGTLTDLESAEPWAIWLNGGPGASSIIGALFENGPLQLQNDYSIAANPWSWTRLADFVFVDQPVGVGFSTTDTESYVTGEDQMASDFFAFLSNLVKVFPSLKARPLYIIGESYAGTYIPYLVKHYFGLTNPPVTLSTFAIGDGTLGSEAVFQHLPMLSVIETYPQIIGYNTEVYNAFKEKSRLCGYDLQLTYPPTGKYPDLNPPGLPGGRTPPGSSWSVSGDNDGRDRQAIFAKFRNGRQSQVPFNIKEEWAKWSVTKRDPSQRGKINGGLNPMYQCRLWAEVTDYALNFAPPWSNIPNASSNGTGFDLYNIPDALNPETVRAQSDASFFMNEPTNHTRYALHAPTSKNWQFVFNYPFGGVIPKDDVINDPSVAPMAFLDDLAANATKHNVRVIIYSGNDDSIVAHRGSEITIQNVTFGGKQGFSRKPSTVWTNDRGEFAGIVHQERNWTFALFDKAGHLVPQNQPENAFVFAREFIFGNNQTGFFDGNSTNGGENKTIYPNNILSGQSGIGVGSMATQSTYFYPSATVAAWESFIKTAAPTPSSVSRNRA